MSYIRVVTAATEEPISLADAKLNLRVDHNDDDLRIQRHITEAREWVERRVQKAIANATMAQAYDAFPVGNAPLVLSITPIASVTGLQYENTSDVTIVMATPADYIFKPPNLLYPGGAAWPVAYNRADSVRAKYIVGEAAVAVLPSPLIAAMHLKIQHLYDGDETDAAIHSLLTNYYTMVA